MSDNLATLFEPLTIGPIEIKNRIALTSLTLLWGKNRVISDRHLDYYEERARGGLGLIITEQQTADRNRLSSFPWGLSALLPESVERYQALAERVHPYGTKVFAQLYGPGVQDTSGRDLDDWEGPLAAYDLPSFHHRETPWVLSAGDIADVVACFATAAGNAADGGLDGVELHGSHGWLLHRFLSPLFNRRTDAYGGSPENRVRIVKEIGEAIRERIGRDRALGLQISVSDYFGDAGVTPELAIEQAGLLTATGLFDYINLSTGNEFTDDQTLPPVEWDHVPTEETGGRLRASGLPDTVKILVQGGVRTPGQAAGILTAGNADLIGMARPLLEDPYWVKKAQEGRAAEIIPAINEATAFYRTFANKPVVSFLNPVTGREGRWGLDNRTPAARSQRVAVVGAGPAGMEAAITAAERGHEVTVFEKSDRVGGHLHLEAVLPHRKRWYEAVRSYEVRASAAGVDVKLGSEVTAETPLDAYDTVLIATGAKWSDVGYQAALPTVPALPRGAADRVLPLDTAIESDPSTLGRFVLIIDDPGQYLPLGLADAVSETGAKVLVISSAATVGQVVATVQDSDIFKRLAQRDVELRAGTAVNGIDGGVATVTELWSGRTSTIEGIDTVVLSTYRTPQRALFDGLSAKHPSVRLIGDAKRPRELPESLADAHDAAFCI